MVVSDVPMLSCVEICTVQCGFLCSLEDVRLVFCNGSATLLLYHQKPFYTHTHTHVKFMGLLAQSYAVGPTIQKGLLLKQTSIVQTFRLSTHDRLHTHLQHHFIQCKVEFDYSPEKGPIQYNIWISILMLLSPHPRKISRFGNIFK